MKNPHYFNQSVVIDVPAELGAEDWQHIIMHLIEHHDALRTGFKFQSGEWKAEIADMPEIVPLEVIDMAEVEEGERKEFLWENGQRLQEGMRLEQPPLLRAALFTAWDKDTNRLMIAIHHLVVDVVSWRIILEDLERMTEDKKADSR